MKSVNSQQHTTSNSSSFTHTQINISNSMERTHLSPYTNHHPTTAKPPPNHHPYPDSAATETSPDDDHKWASKLLRDCAQAISDKDSGKINHLLWMLNELSSPYGDCDQKLAYYFLQALFCKATESGQRCYKTLVNVADKSHCFDSARKLILKFQEVSPWTTFGHVASNGAILEAFDGESKLHIIDISNTLCTQWPTLLEALATRTDETPSLKLTVVVTAAMVRSVMKEITQRMEKFARLMGVPFAFNVINGSDKPLGKLSKQELGVQDDEAVVVNCIGALRRVEVEERGDVIRLFRALNPRVVTVVEEEADFTSSRGDFGTCFEECLRYYTLYFDMLEESFNPTSNERLMLERECSRSIVRVLSCDDEHNIGLGDCERREKGKQWCVRLNELFSPVAFSDDVVDDVKALLKRYRTGWSLASDQANTNTNMDSGILLAWKDEPVVWASAWKP